MLALCWSAARLQTDTVRNLAAHSYSGSAAHALKSKTPLLDLS
jgi:hypothetical protein